MLYYKLLVLLALRDYLYNIECSLYSVKQKDKADFNNLYLKIIRNRYIIGIILLFVQIRI